MVGIARANTAVKGGDPGSAEQHDDHERAETREHRGDVDRRRVGDHVPCLLHRDRPLRVGSGEVGNLAGDDVDRDAGEESDHHGVAHEAGEPAQAKQAGGDHHRARHQREEEQSRWSFVGTQVFDC